MEVKLEVEEAVEVAVAHQKEAQAMMIKKKEDLKELRYQVVV